MSFCDVHVHALWASEMSRAQEVWRSLEHKGLESAALIVMGHHLMEPKRCLRLIPREYHRAMDPDFFRCKPLSLQEIRQKVQLPDPFFYLDSRYLQPDTADLNRFAQAGYQGLKLLYVPEEDRGNGMTGWDNLFGRSKEESQELTASLVEQAAALGWPVILHADLNRYLDFVTALLQSSPKTPFLIPHFGFTRRRMAGLLERFPQCFTDFSSLLPFMLQKPKAYQEFILTHQDRVLFGTDATLG
ncbi:MAG: amidohydrolase family protein, partial [Thermodesulfobacteriota bacterium]